MKLRDAIRSAGIDRPVFLSLVNRASVSIFATVTLGLVVAFLPADRQGYYFTFTSLLVLQTFLELGMGTVLVQFVSHEWSRVRIDPTAHLTGDEIALSRLAGLVRIGLRWYACASLGFFIVVGLVGTFLLTRHGMPEGVLTPWWLLCAAVSCSILQIPLRSCLEGSNQIARVQGIATIVATSAAAVGWVALISGLQLYALALVSGTTAAMGLTLFGRACAPFLRLARSNHSDTHFSWSTEFWPQQWRIAVSYMSGYCVFQSFVPIVFYFLGPVIAGRMGASLQIFNAVHSLGVSWLSTKGPQMGILGAGARMVELQQLVRHTLIRCRAAVAACTVFALLVVYLLNVLHIKADRFIGIVPLALLLGSSVALQRTAIETLAVRFQKIEPFVINSVVSAALMVVSNVVASKYFGVYGVCIGFAVVMVGISSPWVHRIYVAQMAHFTARSSELSSQR